MVEQKNKGYENTADIPEGLKATLDGSTLTISGSKGDVVRRFNNPVAKIEVNDKSIRIFASKNSRKEKRIINTFIAHIENMFKGASEGHEYRLKICSGHFPMNVKINNNVFEVKNFLGEKVPRKIQLIPDVDIKMNGNDITITSVYKEKAGQTAGSIEKLCKVKGRDLRVFQDGIYITYKDGKDVK